MQDPLPNTTQIFAHHLKSFQVMECLVESVAMRVEAEEAYQKALIRSVQKVSQIQTAHPLYSMLIRSFKALSSERVHQVRAFKQQIGRDGQLLKNAVMAVETLMRNQLNDVRQLEKQLRIVFDKLFKSKSSIEQRIKQLDQKFILNQLSMIYKPSKQGRKASQIALGEQQDMLKNYELSANQFRAQVRKFESLSLQRQKKICEYDIRIEQQFVDFIKKFNVHEISLIRNIQYDIDNMIKKTDIFNWQNTTEFKSQISLKVLDKLDIKVQDPYAAFKANIAQFQQGLQHKKQESSNKVEGSLLTAQLQDKQQRQSAMASIKASYPLRRGQIFQFIESFRRNHQFKFEENSFKLLTSQFRQILRAAYTANDLEGVQKIMIFSNSYYCPTFPPLKKKQTILDQIKNEPFLSQFGFWKFYLFFTIREAVISCLNHQQDRQVHMRSSVYSTLLSNSLTMIDCGIQKHHIKNLVGKMVKSYGGLTEVQLSQLLKVVETGYQSYEKSKKIEADQRFRLAKIQKEEKEKIIKEEQQAKRQNIKTGAEEKPKLKKVKPKAES